MLCSSMPSRTLTPINLYNPLLNSLQLQQNNSFLYVDIDDTYIKIAGIDREYDDATGLDKFTNESDDVLLVLSHSPLAFDQFSENDRIFMFAGDTHGGQIKLPLWVYKLFGYEKNVKYNYGMFKKGNKRMFVSRGIGTSHLKFRLFAPPEIAVIEFK